MISPRPIDTNNIEIKSPLPVPTADDAVPDDAPSLERSMTWVTTKPESPSTSNFCAPSIAALRAKSILPSTSPTSLLPVRCTPTESSRKQSSVLSTTALPTEKPVGGFGEIIVCSFPSPQSKNGSRQQEKKTCDKIETDDYFDWAFNNFSGYIAVDEVYDGPFCILSLVDNRTYKRLLYRVLSHDPTSKDILELLKSFQKILHRRELSLYGITTDGSALYTEPVRTVFPGVRHQICEFHIKKEINKSVLKAVAQVRRELDKTKTKRQKRGRPSSREEKATIRKNERIQAKIGALFEHRYLFVQKELSAKEHETLRIITKGLPELRKLREMVDEVYRLYDRRCHQRTALAKLSKLRERLKRFKRLSAVLKKMESPLVERSLVFLEDKRLPSTSNAVERGNRRFRKMQKTVYRVRTCENIKQRISLDMFRDLHLPLRSQTIQTLHHARAG